MSSTDYVAAVLDEIALEGLDGITHEDLWLRLSDRPDFPLGTDFDDALKEYIWNIIKRLKSVSFFELPETRKPLVLFSRYDNVDPELGMVMEPDVLPDNIYPHCKIEQSPTCDVMGSCSTFHTRKDVTELVKPMSYAEVAQRWNHQLVIVANQAARLQALCNSDVNPNLELTAMQYCVLERIGRSRYHGEVTQGKVSLQVIGEDPKTIFYLRKHLHKHRLITKQMFHQKLGTQNCSGLLLHLPRFFMERKPKALVITERVVSYLKTQPNCMAPLERVRLELGYDNPLRKLLKTFNFQKFVRSDLVPHRSIYPDATEAEWKQKHTDKEKVIRILQIIDPKMDIKDIWAKYEDVYEDDEEDKTGFLDEGNRLLDRPMLSQAYRAVEKAGVEGLSQVQIGMELGVTKLQARTICRNLMKAKVVDMYLQDIGRQRVTRFVAKKYVGKLGVQFAKEKQKMLDSQILKDSSISASNETTASSQEAGTSDVQRAYSDFISEMEVSEFDMNDISNVSSPSKENGETKSEDSMKRKASDSPTTEDNTSTNKKMKVDGGTPQSDKKENKEPEPPAVEMEVVDPKIMALRKTILTGLIDGVKGEDLPNSTTFKILKRANMIIEAVQTHKVIYDVSKVHKMINEEEIKEGYSARMDKKTLQRILIRLAADGYVRNLQILLKGYGKKKLLTFVCDPHVTNDHSIIQSAVEQAKMKFGILGREKLIKLNKKEKKVVLPQLKENKSPPESLSVKGKVVEPSKLIYNQRIGRVYGYQPKFMRMQVLHKVIFYLVYGYEGDEKLDQHLAKEELRKDIDFDKDTEDQMSQIYIVSKDWKMFMPPLPKHNGYPNGWCLMSDLFVRLPLSIFIQMVNVSYEISDLEQYLSHPIKKHVLVKNLPLPIRKRLTIARKYIFSIHELVVRLCYIGLIQFGPQRFKEKDQVFIYLNRKAVLLDTTSSPNGYHQVAKNIEYPVHHYNLDSMSSVELYWYDLWSFCMHTLLGGRLCVSGTELVLEPLDSKRAMIEAIESRGAEEAVEKDTGYIPGDHLGAAGLDSAIFSHLKRNWYWAQPKGSTVAPVNTEKETTKRQAEKPFKPIQTARPAPLTSCAKKVKKHREKKIEVVEKPCPKKKRITAKGVIIRHMKPKTPHQRKPYYDQKDKEALMKMSKLRVDWSYTEDNFLLLSKVAAMILGPCPKKFGNTYMAVREVLHSLIPESKNKTSRACQRRINYMLKNPVTQRSVSLCLEEVRQDDKIMGRFGNIYKQEDGGEKLTIQEKETIWHEEFKVLAALLYERYKKISSANGSMDDKLIPDTTQELLCEYVIIKPQGSVERVTGFSEVKNITDVLFATVSTIMHSSFSCTMDKQSWSYQLFNIYQQYPDKLLRAVLARSRADLMISLRKSFMRTRVRSGNYLPLSSLPYQLSYRYINLLQTRYQQELYSDCLEIYKEMLENWQKGDYEVVVQKGGTAAFLAEFMSAQLINFRLEVPDQVIILDPSVEEKDETYVRIVKRYQDILKKYKDTDVTSSVLFDDSFATNDTDVTKDDSSGPESSAAQKGLVLAKAASRIALYFIREECDNPIEQHELQHAHDYFVVNSAKIYCSAKRDKSCENSEEVRVVSTELCSLPNKVKEIISRLKRTCMLPSKDTIDPNLESVVNETNMDPLLVEGLVKLARERKEIGVSIKEIRDCFGGGHEVAKVISSLVERHILLRSGVTSTRYIHYLHVRPWIVKSYSVQRSERCSVTPTNVIAMELSETEGSEIQKDNLEEKRAENSEEVDGRKVHEHVEEIVQRLPKETTKFGRQIIKKGSQNAPILKQNMNLVLRPWFRVDGTLNRRVLDKLLGSVLGHIMLTPGCTLKCVMNRFSPALQPQHIKELAEILQEIDCIHMLSVQVSHKTTLFSRPSVVSVVSATGLEDENDIIMEPQPMAVTRFGMFIGDKAYGKNYLGSPAVGSKPVKNTERN